MGVVAAGYFPPVKFLTERFRRDPLPELSVEDLERVHGGDRGFVPARVADDERDTPGSADSFNATTDC